MSRAKSRAGSRYLGSYLLPSGQNATGELTVNGTQTLLRVHSNEFLQHVNDGASVTGVSYSGELVTLINCLSSGTGSTSTKDRQTTYHADIFPHYVVTGSRHLDSTEANVSHIYFSSTDLPALFYDFDAFSHVIDARPIIDAVLRERRAMRDVESGDRPQVFYFTGKDCVAEVDTVIGNVSVHHRPRFNTGGPDGVYIKNRMVVSIKPIVPVSFRTAIERMYDVWMFLSIAAGRRQGIKSVEVRTSEIADGFPVRLSVYPSYWPKAVKASKHQKPHPADVPLDPIRRREEFNAVLADWMRRQPEWRVARGQYLHCLGKANKFGPQRLVAAANMFDILPQTAVPEPNALATDVVRTRDECIRLLKQLPPGMDRDGALSALGRMGKPSLPKKVMHRAAMVEANTKGKFPDLQLVVSTAMKTRNFFVHGNFGDFDFAKVEPLVPFLTNALEFVFAASDFIEAGWDSSQWIGEQGGWGHSFARFRSDYNSHRSELRNAL